MKAIKAVTLKTAHGPRGDDNPISKLQDLIERLSRGEDALRLNAKVANENYVFCERFCRERRVVFEPGKRASDIINERRGVPIFLNDQATLQESIDSMNAASANVNRIGLEVDETRAQLREFLIRVSAERNGRILEEYNQVIADIIKKILPVCDDEEEANLVAKGLNRSARHHARLFLFRGATDDMLRSHASNFLIALKLDATQGIRPIK
jgi:hypothetical protein